MGFISFIQNLFTTTKVINKPEEDKWINNELNKWKVDLMFNNIYMQTIPNDRIIKQRSKIKEEYRLKYRD